VTPADLARLHAQAFISPRPWTEAEFAEILASTGAFLVTDSEAFALGRVIADEAELLTIAVPAHARRSGAGLRLMQAFAANSAALGARTGFLEVAADNIAALALYHRHGWAEAGRRRLYYARPEGAVDALILTRPIAGQ
jgi:ribosomal-protein-alanine N-acetyltransferase